MAIELRDASFSYGGSSAPSLRGASLSIRRGECVLLCGESGCGKTTLTRLLNGLAPHFYEGLLGGTAAVAGHSVADSALDVLAGIVGSVFQNPRGQFFCLDTDGEIAFGCENLGMPPDEIARRVCASAASLGIAHLLGRSIFALSGGEKQLVAVASAHALSPDIFVFDEPSSNLDQAAIAKLQDAMSAMKQSGKTIIVAEHRLHWLTGLMDRAIYMEGGRVAGDWTAAAFLSIPDRQRAALGLRALSHDALIPTAPAAPSMANPAGAAEGAAPPATHAHGAASPTAPSMTGAAGAAEGASPHSAPLLRAESICAWHERGKPVLRGISFDAFPGEAIAIIGRSGSGKTTLARALCGLHGRQSGGLWLGGKPLRPGARPGPIYLVMQEPGYQLFTDSVERELTLSKNRRSRPAPEKVEAALSALSLGALRDRHPMSLSGGERQRVAIGAALASGAAAIVFDEPTSGLDLKGMRRVCAVIERLRADGKAVFVITHDYELLLAACTRALMLSDGELIGDFPLTRENLHCLKALFP